MEQVSNHIILRGVLAGAPVFSHENHGRRFFRFPLEVARLSGTADILPVVADETLLEDTVLTDGDSVEVTGQVRSCNCRGETGRHLVISVYASTLGLCDGEPENTATLQGVICKAPVYRRTPLGREICDVMLAVCRHYRRTAYLPCILWGKSAREVACLSVGAPLHLTGRLQSRGYTKVVDGVPQQRVAYEISAMESLCPV